MKKFILIMAMILSVSVQSFAENKNLIDFNDTKYEVKVNNRRLACILGITIDQYKMICDVMDELRYDMKSAKYTSNDEDSIDIVKKAVIKNTKHMRYILNKQQYEKYAKLLNLTLSNSGFDTEVMSI